MSQNMTWEVHCLSLTLDPAGVHNGHQLQQSCSDQIVAHDHIATILAECTESVTLKG